MTAKSQKSGFAADIPESHLPTVFVAAAGSFLPPSESYPLYCRMICSNYSRIIQRNIFQPKVIDTLLLE
jgi:hypothetical protein